MIWKYITLSLIYVISCVGQSHANTVDFRACDVVFYTYEEAGKTKWRFLKNTRPISNKEAKSLIDLQEEKVGAGKRNWLFCLNTKIIKGKVVRHRKFVAIVNKNLIFEYYVSLPGAKELKYTIPLGEFKKYLNKEIEWKWKPVEVKRGMNRAHRLHIDR